MSLVCCTQNQFYDIIKNFIGQLSRVSWNSQVASMRLKCQYEMYTDVKGQIFSFNWPYNSDDGVLLFFLVYLSLSLTLWPIYCAGSM